MELPSLENMAESRRGVGGSWCASMITRELPRRNTTSYSSLEGPVTDTLIRDIPATLAPFREIMAAVIAEVAVKAIREGKKMSCIARRVICVATTVILIALLGSPLTLSCSRLGTDWFCLALFRARSR